MRVDGKSLVIGFIIGLAFWATAWALTVDQIWNNVYESSSQSIRLKQVN